MFTHQPRRYRPAWFVPPHAHKPALPKTSPWMHSCFVKDGIIVITDWFGNLTVERNLGSWTRFVCWSLVSERGRGTERLRPAALALILKGFALEKELLSSVSSLLQTQTKVFTWTLGKHGRIFLLSSVGCSLRVGTFYGDELRSSCLRRMISTNPARSAAAWGSRVRENSRKKRLEGWRSGEKPCGGQWVLPSSKDSTPESQVLAASFSCRLLMISSSSEPELF